MATAANVDPLDEMETVLKCSICKEVMNDPRTLPCHHTFCKVCLTRYVQVHRDEAAGRRIEVFNCPDCRVEFNLKYNERVEGMGSSHLVRNMLEVLKRQAKRKTKCSRCEEQTICWCSSCDVFMCQKCFDNHQSWSLLEKHCVKMENIECHLVTPRHCDFKLHNTSTILTNQPVEYLIELQEWLGDQFGWECCYRASRDGSEGTDFHRHCDGMGPTVTLVKVKDYIFGGYTDQDWTPCQPGDGLYKSSHNSFLFSLHNKDNLPPFVAPLKSDHHHLAICCRPSWGPFFGGTVFGRGNDLAISLSSPSNYSSYSNFGHSYQLPFDYNYKDDRTQSLLAGSFGFTPSEIEVFH